MKFFKSKKAKKILAVVSAVVISLMSFCCLVFATETPVTSPADLGGDDAVEAAQGLFNQVAGVLNFGNIAKVLGIGIAAVIGIWLAWWGLRKLVRMLLDAIRTGKVRF